MEFNYSSNERTTRVTGNGIRRVTNTKSRKVRFRTSKTKRQGRKAINWGAVLAFLVQVALAAVKGLLGSGKHHIGFLPEQRSKMQEGYRGAPITSLDGLATTLSVPKAELTYFANNMSKHIRQIVKRKKDGKPRLIAAPSNRLTTILQRTRTIFFDDYTYPDYVYGLGGNSLRDHASVHVGRNELIQADLTDFFPSITHSAVHEMWINHFLLPPELARILTMLTTFDYRLQQGFATSSHIAAVVALPLTQGLNDHCHVKGMRFSQYVDDLNFSGGSIDKRELFKQLITLARANGLSVKKRKTNSYNAKAGKIVTGVSVYGERLRTPRRVRQRAVAVLKNLSNEPQNKSLIKSAVGYQGYIAHLNRAEGKRYKEKLDKILPSSNKSKATQYLPGKALPDPRRPQ